MKKKLIYMTMTDAAEARAVARALLEERLVACANMIDNVSSMYWWEGAMQEDTEVVVIAKTTAALVPAVVDRVKELHSYDCPCVVSCALEDGNPEFLEWIESVSR